MTITSIVRQKRDPRRLSIYIDGKFAFGIHEDVFVRQGLRKGDKLDRGAIQSIEHLEELGLARRHALRMLGYRMRTERELRTRLEEEEFDPGVVRETLAELRSMGLVDDEKFARAFLHDSQIRKPSGRRLLERQLKLKGVPQDVIRRILGEETEAEETRRAYEAAQLMLKRFRASRKSLGPEKQERRLAQFLARRGFGWESISPVLRQMYHGRSPAESEE